MRSARCSASQCSPCWSARINGRHRTHRRRKRKTTDICFCRHLDCREFETAVWKRALSQVRPALQWDQGLPRLGRRRNIGETGRRGGRARRSDLVPGSACFTISLRPIFAPLVGAARPGCTSTGEQGQPQRETQPQLTMAQPQQTRVTPPTPLPHTHSTFVGAFLAPRGPLQLFSPALRSRRLFCCPLLPRGPHLVHRGRGLHLFLLCAWDRSGCWWGG